MNTPPKILVIDDDPVLRLMLARTLGRLGYEVVACADGVEGFRTLEELGGGALLVLDYEMPKFNGAQVCEIIRTHSSPDIAQTPIILLTGHTGENHEVECLKAGADDFVTKPVNIPVLRARIETHLRLATLRKELQERNRQAEEWRALHERDLESARLVQQAIIPQAVPELPGWEFAARHQSLIQVGGDIYDWLRLRDGNVLFWIADATGHGASAALLTTFTKLLFRYAIAEGSQPQEVIRSVNRDFRAIFRGHLYFTAACALLDPATGGVCAAGAGHPPLVILRGGGAVEPLESMAPPVGLVLESGQPEPLHATLEPGDTLLLFTDGLYSVSDEEGEHLPFPRFLETLAGEGAASAAGAIELAIRRAVAAAGNDRFDDDLAVIAIRRQ